MRELQERQKDKQKLFSIKILVPLAVFTAIVLRGTYGVIEKERQSAADVAALTVQVATLSQKDLELKDNIARLKTDPGVEEEIKERYNVSAEGEHVAVIVDQGTTSSSTATTTRAWYSRMWSAILSEL